MIVIVRVAYLLLVGYLLYTMVKRGGCCGGHGNHDSHNGDQSCENKEHKRKTSIITDNEKKDAINLE